MSRFEPGMTAFLASPRAWGRLAIVTNASACDRAGVHLVDRLAAKDQVEIRAIFTPEHGLFADAPDGEPVASGKHPRLGIPVISLFGDRHAPKLDELADLDAVVYDIQDVGVRFYTYVSTLAEVMSATAPAGVPLIVLDRPNPIGAHLLEGPMLEPAFSSFVGRLPVPLRYGMTAGELALWLKKTQYPEATVEVVPCAGFRRSSPYPQDFPWHKPSPSMPAPETAMFYPGTCLFEGTNLSEGRGTDAPFQIIGAPFIDGQAWARDLLPKMPPNVWVDPVTFEPTFSKFTGVVCRGVRLRSSLPTMHDAVKVGLIVLASALELYGDKIEFIRRAPDRPPFFDLLAGCSWLREGLLARTPVLELWHRANTLPIEFLEQRTSVRLYGD